MDNEFANEPYQQSTSIVLGQYNITNIWYYGFTRKENVINSTKQVLNLYICKGECCTDEKERQFYKCKLNANSTNETLCQCCPYIRYVLQINEPRKKSATYKAWQKALKLLELRQLFGLYTDYVYENIDKDINIDLYAKLKVIPEFSLKHLYNLQYNIEEIYSLLKEDPKRDISSLIPNRYYNTYFENQLYKLYKDDVKEYQNFLNCRVFMDAEDINYLEWKAQHINDKILISIGDYYMFNTITYNTKHFLDSQLFSVSAIQTDSYTAFLSFKKKDIRAVAEYVQKNNLFSYNFFNRYVKEYFQQILELIQENKFDYSMIKA